MKPIAWQKQDLRTNKIPPDSTLHQIRAKIDPYSESPYLDALVLLTHITSKSKSDLLAHPSPELTVEQSTHLESSLNKIMEGIPLPYVLGYWEFYKLEFKVTPDVLIPRPESEWLVETGIAWLVDHPQRRIGLDLGTGSGCLAISLAKDVKDLKMIATDLSFQALQVAQENAQRHSTHDRIYFAVADLMKGIQTKVDFIVANLPYIPTSKLKKLPVYRTEPPMALDGGQDGLLYIKEILENILKFINPGGIVLLELDETCGDEALLLAQKYNPGTAILLQKDLSGQDRYLQIQIQ